MKDLVDAKLILEKQRVLSGVQLITEVTLAKITLKKPYLLFQKGIHKKSIEAALNQKQETSVQSQHTSIKSTLDRALF